MKEKHSLNFGKKEKVLNYATQTYQLSRPNKVGAYVGAKTSFLPNLKNKTTSVAKQYNAHNNLITSLKTSTMI
jgi:hypothetical protein